MSKSFTIVTSLIDINRDSWENKFRRGFDLYLYYMSKYLVMDCYFYIFIIYFSNRIDISHIKLMSQVSKAYVVDIDEQSVMKI